LWFILLGKSGCFDENVRKEVLGQTLF